MFFCGVVFFGFCLCCFFFFFHAEVGFRVVCRSRGLGLFRRIQVVLCGHVCVCVCVCAFMCDKLRLSKGDLCEYASGEAS